MDQGSFSAVSGALAALRRLDVLSNNLANARTPGFKAQLVVEQAARGGPLSPVRDTVPDPIDRHRVVTDFVQGAVERTGDPFHLAIQGEGFFVVATDRGERLTRRGSFSLDPQGYLVTSEGHRVQGEGGDVRIGTAAVDTGPIEIGSDGTIRSGVDQIGRIRVVVVGDPQAMRREPGALFDPGSQVAESAPEGSFRLEQGALEAANVSPIEELSTLVSVSRAFEAYLHATQRFDAITAQAIREVGRV